MLVLFGMPIAQILIFGFALTNEVKDTRIAVLDNSKDVDTEGIIHKLDASSYFDIELNLMSTADIDAAFKSGKIKMAVVFQSNFRENLLHTGKAQVQLIADASDPNLATTVVNYASAIIVDYQMQINQTVKLPLSIGVETRMLYNPQLKAEYNLCQA